MISMKRLFVLGAFAVLAFGSASAWSAPVLRAVLVGVERYQNMDAAGIRQLYGPRNDVDELRSVLRDRFGLGDSRTTVLLDEQATRAALLGALRKTLLDDALPGDVVLFYFAGHGARIHDVSGDEASRSDSTILPYDARATPGKPLDISDDELGALLIEARAKGIHPTVILDSCFSGTGTRKIARTRSAPRTFREHTPSTSSPVSGSMRDLGGQGPVLLAAARDTEESIETERHGRVQGEFTRMLISVLRAAEENVSYLDVINRVRGGLAELGVSQYPQGEGPLPLRFLGSGPLGRHPLSAELVGERTVRLLAGAASNVTTGSEYDFFASAATASASSVPVARGIVTTVDANRAEVQLTQKANGPKRLFAMERSHAYGKLRLPIAVTGEDNPRSELSAQLAKLEFLDLSPRDVPSYTLHVAGGQVEVTRLDGSMVGAALQLATQVELLQTLLARLAHVHAILGLRNPAKQVSPITAQLLLAKEQPGKYEKPPIRDGAPHLKAGQVFVVSLFNTEAKKRYAYLLNLTPDLCVRLVSPPSYAGDQPLEGQMYTPPWKAGPVRGREYFLVLASDKPVPLEAMQQPCMEGLTRSARTFADPLARLLSETGSTTRNADYKLPLDGWSTSLINMVVE